MDRQSKQVITKFLRTYREPFSVSEFNGLFKALGYKYKNSEVENFLLSDERVFPLKDGQFLTKAGAFTGMVFSFPLLEQEIEQKVFVPGDRCIPFVDGEWLSCQLKFKYKGKYLPYSFFETDCNTARSLFTLFGDEYASQYIAADPLNEDSGIENNCYELPPKLNLTAVSIEKPIKEFNLQKGDRILCRIENWDKGVIEIFPVSEHSKNPFVQSSRMSDRIEWNKKLENGLLKIFDTMGPCSSIEQQLAFVFVNNRSDLCVPECGSIKECIESSSVIDMELFGVETRLWKKGQDVPAIGEWNREFLFARDFGSVPVYGLPLPDYLIDCLIKDQFFAKKKDFNLKKSDVDLILEKMLTSSMKVTDEQKEMFTLQLMYRSVILRKQYNWFADFSVGSIRHKAIELYARVGELVYEVDCAAEGLEKFPQQELVTLSQLFSHISRILEMLSSSKDCRDEEKNALGMSLEGMEYNFEDIRGRLKIAVDQFFAEGFKVI